MTIRAASVADLAAVQRIVAAAYGPYVERLGRPPAPMLDDYAARLREGSVWVAENDGAVCGLVVLLPQTDHLLLDNIAVDPARQGQGTGRALMDFSEHQAVARGLAEIRLYTNALMVENISRYLRLGFRETGRAEEHGFSRVFFAKPVAATA